MPQTITPLPKAPDAGIGSNFGPMDSRMVKRTAATVVWVANELRKPL
jgi:hypothetical protein